MAKGKPSETPPKIAGARTSENVATFECELKSYLDSALFLLLSDLHLDHPDCRRDVLTKHLQDAQQRGAKVLLNGDTLCAMQGKNDKRHTKSALRKEYAQSSLPYFDAIVQDACEFFAPYADTLAFIGLGNHETAIFKYYETDLIARFVHRFNNEFGGKVVQGGYGGWIRVVLSASGRKAPYNIKYFHGSGGGGAVTKGLISDNRLQVFIENADLIWQGHVHELYNHVSVTERLVGGEIRMRHVDIVRTACYKDEYGKGFSGWHVERGAPPKPLGGYWLELRHSGHSSSPDALTAVAQLTQCRMPL